MAAAFLRAVVRRAHGAFNICADDLLTGQLIAETIGRGRSIGVPGSALRPLLRAAQVSLGALGILTSVTLRLEEAHALHLQNWMTHIDWVLENFEDLEPLFRRFSGRPHWGKKHSLKAPQLRMLYPEWTKFQDIRRSMDPEGIFMNDYLRELFGEEER